MANLYGVANGPGLPINATVGTGNLSLVHDAWTTVYTSPPLIAPSPGYWFAMLFGVLNLAVGATPPASFNAGLAIGAGSMNQTLAIGANGFIANASFYLPVTVFTVASQSAWQGAGSTVSLGCFPTTNTMSTWNLSGVITMLFRAADQ